MLSFAFLLHFPYVESSWNVMAHGDAREGKWRGKWRMEWVASPLTLPRNMVYPALLPLMRTPRLPGFDWTDASADLNGLVRFTGRWNLISARVTSHFKRSLTPFRLRYWIKPLFFFRCAFLLAFKSHCHILQIRNISRNIKSVLLGIILSERNSPAVCLL